MRNGKFHDLRKTSTYFKTAEYLGACFEDEAISNIKIKNTKGLTPSDSLLLCLIRRSLFSFRPSFPFRLPFPPPFRHSRENGNPVVLSGSRIKRGMTRGMDPQSEALRFRLRMTRNVSFPRKRESRQDWIPHQVRDDGRGWIPNPKRYTFG